MDILFVCDTMGSGGAERVISNLSNFFSLKGHKVSILMLGQDANGSFYRINNNVELLHLSNTKMSFLKKVKNIKIIITNKSPKIVISFLSYVCIYVWLALRHTKIPYIVSERNDPHYRGKLKQFLLNKSFKGASGCVFQTEDAANWYSNVISCKYDVIFNPVSLDYIGNDVPNIKKQILSVGRLSTQKNYPMLVEAFAIFSKNHPDYIFKIYGDGPFEKNLKKQIMEYALDDKIFVLPNSKNWHKDEFDSSLFLLGSKYEGMPNVLAEALCLGIPCVSTNCTIGGPKELKKIFPKLLILSKSYNASDFASAMEKALLIDHKSFFVPNELKLDIIGNKWLSFIDEIVK